MKRHHGPTLTVKRPNRHPQRMQYEKPKYHWINGNITNDTWASKQEGLGKPLTQAYSSVSHQPATKLQD